MSYSTTCGFRRGWGHRAVAPSRPSSRTSWPFP